MGSIFLSDTFFFVINVLILLCVCWGGGGGGSGASLLVCFNLLTIAQTRVFRCRLLFRQND